MPLHLSVLLRFVSIDVYLLYIIDASKISALASMLHNMNGKIPKELSAKLNRFQGFTTLPSKKWTSKQYFSLAFLHEPFSTNLLESVIEAMELKVVKKDGSFLSAFETLLNDVLKLKLPTHLKGFIETVVKGNSDAQKELKDLIVNELQGFRKDFYKLTEIESKSVESLLDMPGFNELSHQLPSAVSLIFNLPIIIVSTVCDLPMFPALPTDWSINQPLFILFDVETKSFHALVGNEKLDENTNGCFCGNKAPISKSGETKKTKKKKHCANNMRCSCLRSKKSCSSSCKCKHCGNNKDTIEPSNKRRKRFAHNMTVNDSSETTFLQYLLNKEEIDDPPVMTSIQHFILEASLCFLKVNSSDWNKTIDGIVENLYQKQLTLNSQTINLLDSPGTVLTDKNIVEKWFDLRRKKCEGGWK